MVGRCVTHTPCLDAASLARRSPTERATSPPMPASTSSKISVLIRSEAASTPLIASMTRESSPPEAIERRRLNGSPGVGGMRNSQDTRAARGRAALLAQPPARCDELALRAADLPFQPPFLLLVVLHGGELLLARREVCEHGGDRAAVLALRGPDSREALLPRVQPLGR